MWIILTDGQSAWQSLSRKIVSKTTLIFQIFFHEFYLNGEHKLLNSALYVNEIHCENNRENLRTNVVIYEVNLVVDEAVKLEYAKWLPVHIREILALKGFESAKWLHKEAEENDEKGKTCWTIQYYLTDRKSLDDYLRDHAPHFRKDGLDRFGANFSAWRQVFEIKENYKVRSL